MLNICPVLTAERGLGNSLSYIIQAWSGFETNVACSNRGILKDHELKTR